MGRALDRLAELIEPHRAALLARHEQAEGNRGKPVRKPLVEEWTVRVIDHYPLVAFGSDGHIGVIERS